MLLVIITNMGDKKEENGGKNEKNCKFYNGNVSYTWFNGMC